MIPARKLEVPNLDQLHVYPLIPPLEPNNRAMTPKEGEIGPMNTLVNDSWAMIFSYITEDKDICNLERVCKRFHYVSRNKDEIWKARLAHRWPMVQMLPSSEVPYQTQFKILRHRIDFDDETGLTEKQVREEIRSLRGPSGFDGKIHQAWVEMKAAEESIERIRQFYKERIRQVLPGIFAENYLYCLDFALICNECKLMNLQLEDLNNQLKILVGNSCDGTDESISSFSLLGRAIAVNHANVPRLRADVVALRGADGSGGKIDLARRNLRAANQSKNEKRRIFDRYPHVCSLIEGNPASFIEILNKYRDADEKYTLAIRKLNLLQNLYRRLVGDAFDGTDVSLQGGALREHLRLKSLFKKRVGKEYPDAVANTEFNVHLYEIRKICKQVQIIFIFKRLLPLIIRNRLNEVHDLRLKAQTVDFFKRYLPLVYEMWLQNAYPQPQVLAEACKSETLDLQNITYIEKITDKLLLAFDEEIHMSRNFHCLNLPPQWFSLTEDDKRELHRLADGKGITLSCFANILISRFKREGSGADIHSGSRYTLTI